MSENATIGEVCPDGSILALYYLENGAWNYPKPEPVGDEIFPNTFYGLEEWLSAYTNCEIAFLASIEGMRAYFRVITGISIYLDENGKIVANPDGPRTDNICHWVNEDGERVTGEMFCQM